MTRNKRLSRLAESIISNLPPSEPLAFTSVFEFLSSGAAPYNMYFSGACSDSTNGGGPVMALVVGYHDEGCANANTMPDGRTILKYLNERAKEYDTLNNQALSSSDMEEFRSLESIEFTQFLHDGKTRNHKIIRFWNHEDWVAYQARREARHRVERTPEE